MDPMNTFVAYARPALVDSVSNAEFLFFRNCRILLQLYHVAMFGRLVKTCVHSYLRQGGYVFTLRLSVPSVSTFA